jgi:hypothetical protein
MLFKKGNYGISLVKIFEEFKKLSSSGISIYGTTKSSDLYVKKIILYIKIAEQILSKDPQRADEVVSIVFNGYPEDYKPLHFRKVGIGKIIGEGSLLFDLSGIKKYFVN